MTRPVVARDERAPQPALDVHGHGDARALAHRDEPPRHLAVELGEVDDVRRPPVRAVTEAVFSPSSVKRRLGIDTPAWPITRPWVGPS